MKVDVESTMANADPGFGFGSAIVITTHADPKNCVQLVVEEYGAVIAA